MSYLLDANVFIEAKNRYYSFDLCPGFWEWLESAHDAGTVGSIDKVGDELLAGNDELAAWSTRVESSFFAPMDAAVIPHLTTVSEFVNDHRLYDEAAANHFFSGADYYLIAFALAHGGTVVTHEVAAPQAKKVKIPTVCVALGVKFTNPFQMLRAEGVRFTLDR